MDRTANAFLALGGKLDQPVVVAVPSAFLKRRPTERIISYQVESEDGECLVKFCGKLPVGICVDTLRCKALQDIADMLSRPTTRKSLSIYENRRVFLEGGEPLDPESMVIVADDKLQKDNLFVVVEKSVLVPTTGPRAKWLH
ncbi:hypothetical protein Poli38472_004002 [Pythium oligandrum]|uniref:Uncharacterized protein n=1 Tax=Pythium oligandrum TaxID=41045 RepID=A0A8K1CPH3_PYTOL|nr:hypothetical protein Poli38472_004002 [Pythium oligandrum]|eukprot:TMW66237.1 hypothetical protein Poli38472_004002 [Pythium oligandrum]